MNLFCLGLVTSDIWNFYVVLLYIQAQNILLQTAYTGIYTVYYCLGSNNVAFGLDQSNSTEDTSKEKRFDYS